MNVASIPVPPAGAPDPAPETFGVVELLAGLPVVAEDLAAVQDVRLTAAVAAALRATLDWLTGEVVPLRPLRVRADDAALEVVLERVDGRGLQAAGDVLAAVGGNLGRVESARPDAPWVARMPIHAAREQFVMVIEGGVPLAFAWPAVIHIVMARADELGAGLSAPRVPSFVQGAGPDEAARGNSEFPVILLGHGLKRGYYVAERLVWRLPGVPIETVAPPPVAGLTHAVQSEEGDCYWVADPGWLLQAVEEPTLEVPTLEAPSLPERPAPPQPAPVLSATDVHPLELVHDDVEPLDDVETPAGPASAPPPEPVIEAPPPAPPAPAPAIALAPAIVPAPAVPSPGPAPSPPPAAMARDRPPTATATAASTRRHTSPVASGTTSSSDRAPGSGRSPTTSPGRPPR